MHRLASIHDSAAQIETTGLAPSRPELRPADIFCSGPSGLVALDVCVCSPFAISAGSDCCESAFVRKRNDYRDILEELRQQGIEYRPLVFSAYGRPHAETSKWLEFSARAAARKRGISDFKQILSRVYRNIAVAIQRRFVEQIRACLPCKDVFLDEMLSRLAPDDE